MKVKAYHSVEGGAEAVQAIIAHGAIVPATQRVNPKVAESLCSDFVKQLKASKESAPGATVAVLSLLGERLGEITSRPPYSEDTRFYCEDLLAGDAARVFLSLDAWLEQAEADLEGQMSGFVFDAKQLVREGASLRKRDLLDDYWAAISVFLTSTTGEKSPTALKRKLDAVRLRGQVSGPAAAAELRRPAYYRPSEVVWHGALPVEWAVEVWEMGERTR